MDERELKQYWESVDSSQYTDWMKEFERLSILDDKYPEFIDIDYSVVDDMFRDNLTPAEAVERYWERL